MFIAVRKYQVRRGSGVEWTKRVQDSFVPLMRELKGFRGYYLVDGGPDVIITVTMFDQTHRDDREAADRSPVVSQITRACILRGIQQHWRDEEGERLVHCVA